MRKKDDEVGNKTGYKKKGKGKKKGARKKIEIDSKKKFKFWLMRRKTEKLVITSKLKIMSLVLEISFLVIPIEQFKKENLGQNAVFCW